MVVSGAGAGAGGCGAAGGCTAVGGAAGATNGTGAGAGATSVDVLNGAISGAISDVVVVLVGGARVVVAFIEVTAELVTSAGDDDAGPQPDITTAPTAAAAIAGTLRHSNRKTWPFMPTDPAPIPGACTPFSNALALSVPTTQTFPANRSNSVAAVRCSGERGYITSRPVRRVDRLLVEKPSSGDRS
ncbi:hypothetical protein ABZ412_29125 [Nocardia sp. NPDC005746]|uniref:hypothetical protein n=1 Tax=Nocardia sp. NPDC005746 TaxID=3157062 RepID=UPI0033D882B7